MENVEEASSLKADSPESPSGRETNFSHRRSTVVLTDVQSEVFAVADNDELEALQAQLERKKSKSLLLLEKRKAREEAQRLQRELDERFNAQTVAAAMELQNFTKCFLEFVEILPREERARDQQQVAELTRRPTRTSFFGSLSHGDSGEGEESGAEEPTSVNESGTQFCAIPAFLLRAVENFFARIGVVLRKKVGPGGVVSHEQYKRAFGELRVEMPDDVIGVMLTFVKILVVPPPVVPEDKMPFDITSDDETWEKVSQNTREWLSVLGVDDTVLNLESLRTLLSELRKFPLPSLTRVLQYVTRDIVTVLAQAARDSKHVIVEDDVTANIHHHGGPRHGASRRPTFAGAEDSVHVHLPHVARSSTPNLHEISGVSLSPARHPERRHVIVAPLAGPTSVHQRHIAVSGSLQPSLQKPSHPGIEVHGRPADPPLCFSDYSRIAPANWVKQQSDEDVLLDAHPLRFGCEVGEPPIAGTPFRAVLQAKVSHYLYTAKNLPMHATSTTATAADEMMSRTVRLQSSVRGGAKKVSALQREKLFREALDSHTASDGRAVVTRDFRDELRHLGTALSHTEKQAIMSSFEDGAALVAAHQRAVMKGKRPAKRNISVVSRTCLPLPEDSAQGTASAVEAKSHLVLPLEPVQRLLAAVEQTDKRRAIRLAAAAPLSVTPFFSAKQKAASGAAGEEPARSRSSTPAITIRDVFVTDTGAPNISDTAEAVRARMWREEAAKRLQQAKLNQRKTVRLATLLSLQGKDARLEGESLANYWERLQALEFKLSVLRGGTMPDEERFLWKQLSIACHEKIEDVFATLKRQAQLQPTHASGDDGGAAALVAQLTASVIGGGIEHHLDELLKDYRQRALERTNRSMCDVTVSDAPHFATPVVRKVRRSKIERMFEERGVAALDEYLSAAKTTPTRRARTPL